jgi:hypothetical protein
MPLRAGIGLGPSAHTAWHKNRHNKKVSDHGACPRWESEEISTAGLSVPIVMFRRAHGNKGSGGPDEIQTC